MSFNAQYNFQGQYDLVKFIKMIGEHGMYASLRLGPFIQAEWNHGYNSIFTTFICLLSLIPV